MKHFKFINIVFLLLIVTLLFVSCSSTKYLTDQQSFLKETKVNINSEIESDSTFLSTVKRKLNPKNYKKNYQNKVKKSALEKELQRVIVPKPNKNKFRRWLFYKSQNSESRMGKWIANSLATKPVIYQEDFKDINFNRLKKYLFNKGYFNTQIFHSAKIKSKKKAFSFYDIKLQPVYNFGKIELPKPNDFISKLITLRKYDSFIKTGKNFSIESLQKERERLNDLIREKGYYQFNNNFINFDLDSTKNDKKVNVIYKIKSGINDSLHKKSYIRNVEIKSGFVNDALTYNSFDTLNVSYKYQEINIDPAIIIKKIKILKDDAYSTSRYSKSINGLINLGIYKFINITYKPYIENNYDSLDVFVNLTLKPKLEFELDLEINSKSDIINVNNTTDENSFNLGSAISLTHSNLNTFGSAEKFTASILGGLENQFIGKNLQANAIDIVGQLSLAIPKIILPKNKFSNSVNLPKTIVGLGANYLRRLEYYTLTTFKANYGYQWQKGTRKLHQLNLINLSYLNVTNTTNRFDSLLLNNSALQRSFDKQFLFSTEYTYSYQSFQSSKSKNRYFYKGSIETSGNAINGIYNLFNNNAENKLFNVLLGQFFKVNSEYKYYRLINENQVLANRIKGGLGFAYGNSNVLPYAKQYFIGGTNSIRAFGIRSLGPGTYSGQQQSDDDPNIILIDQTGELSLELNSEYRFKLNKYLGAAIFVDIGNIWNLRRNESLPESTQFKLNRFYKEFAIGTGLGLRLDLSYFVLRMDAAFPIRKPFYTDGDRWVFKYIDFSNKDWRQDNLIFNLAIGYPF